MKYVLPKEQTQVVPELDADQLEYTSTGTEADGSPFLRKYTRPKQGGVWRFQQGGSAEGEPNVTIVIYPYNWYTTFLQNGKQWGVVHTVVSKDGKTKRDTFTGTDAQGKRYEQLVVWEKQ